MPRLLLRHIKTQRDHKQRSGTQKDRPHSQRRESQARQKMAPAGTFPKLAHTASPPAQLKLLKGYAAANGFTVAREYVNVETAKQTGRAAFGEMMAYLKAHPSIRVMLVEKADRLYRNLKDWVTVDELDVPRKASCSRASCARPKSSCTASKC